MDIYPRIEEILHDRTIVFSDSYFNFLIEIKPKVKLLSSENTFSIFEEYYNFIRKTKLLYDEFCCDNDPENDPKHFWIDTTPDGKEYEANDITEQDFQYFSVQKKITSQKTHQTQILLKHT